MWRQWLKTGSASILSATRLDRVVAGMTGDSRRPLVLGYHRVVPEFRPDPTISLPSMDISESMLEAQLDWVARRFRIVSLDELGPSLPGDDPREPPVAAITVDDGYWDAYEIAFPLFRRKGIPAAFFVVTDLIGTADVPLHDRLYYQLARGYAREGHVPRAIWPVLDRMELDPDTRLPLARADKPYDALQILFHALSQGQLAGLADMLEAEAPLPTAVADRLRCVDWSMLRSMADGGMTIGSHTRSHVFLTREPPSAVHDEAVESRRRLEAQLARRVDHFAYPAGQFDATAVTAVAGAGYRFAYTCCTHVVPSHPHLTIPRKLLWERSCIDGDGRFSSAVMSAQVSGFFELVRPQCASDHGFAHRSALATAAS